MGSRGVSRTIIHTPQRGFFVDTCTFEVLGELWSLCSLTHLPWSLNHVQLPEHLDVRRITSILWQQSCWVVHIFDGTLLGSSCWNINMLPLSGYYLQGCLPCFVLQTSCRKFSPDALLPGYFNFLPLHQQRHGLAHCQCSFISRLRSVWTIIKSVMPFL